MYCNLWATLPHILSKNDTKSMPFSDKACKIFPLKKFFPNSTVYFSPIPTIQFHSISKVDLAVSIRAGLSVLFYY